jgi:hypothetical protein
MNESRKHLLNVRAGLERPNDKTKKALF